MWHCPLLVPTDLSTGLRAPSPPRPPTPPPLRSPLGVTDVETGKNRRFSNTGLWAAAVRQHRTEWALCSFRPSSG